jgi:hypothetical protein
MVALRGKPKHFSILDKSNGVLAVIASTNFAEKAGAN